MRGLSGRRQGLLQVCVNVYNTSKGPLAGCSTIAPLPTIQKGEPKCLYNGEPITTLSSGQE